EDINRRWFGRAAVRCGNSETEDGQTGRVLTGSTLGGSPSGRRRATGVGRGLPRFLAQVRDGEPHGVRRF
ncbi:unnamed protein product, partial [Ectocarpus sp. 4 AP-2014]